MRKRKLESWVVYRTPATSTRPAVNAVCEQGEWVAMELAKPGERELIQAGFDNEAEAEKLARGTSGDPIPRAARKNAAPRPDASGIDAAAS